MNQSEIMQDQGLCSVGTHLSWRLRQQRLESWRSARVAETVRPPLKEGMPGAEYNVIVRKVFDDEEEGYEFYNNYAKGKGFSVRKDYCEWDIGHNERTLRHFVCSVKVSAKRRSWRGRIRSGSRGILLGLDALLSLWLHGIRTLVSGMWRISSANTTIWWWNKILLVFFGHIEESDMSRKLILWWCRFLGSANTR